MSVFSAEHPSPLVLLLPKITHVNMSYNGALLLHYGEEDVSRILKIVWRLWSDFRLGHTIANVKVNI